jgi:LysM repeat protein
VKNMKNKNTQSTPLFIGISWGVTALIVISLLGFTFWQILPAKAGPTFEPTPTEVQAGTVPLSQEESSVNDPQAIVRKVALETSVDQSITYEVRQYTVKQGDSVFGIAKEFNIKPETLLWANYDILQDSPDSIRAGQVLNIPPTDGVYYQWKEGDTLQAVADEFGASVDDILNWPGNTFDLTDPEIQQGTYVMIPSGHREFVQWIIPTMATGRSGTATVGGTTCAAGPVGSGAFIWPTTQHWVSGNDYWSGHLAIDIAAAEGAPVWAADAGVVTMAQGGWNGGYGNVVMIDHGNGYITLYGHLSQINVVPCQGVSAGTLIGLAGNTGNSFGAHLHFEVRLNGGFVNPHYVLPSP